MAPSVEKKIAELEMGLMHLQQNIDIPEINLVIDRTVLTAIKKASDEGRKAKVADFGDKIEDASFLNSLQSGVNRWIREIQKVRLPLSNFCTSLCWNELEWPLHRFLALLNVWYSLVGYKVGSRSCVRNSTPGS